MNKDRLGNEAVAEIRKKRARDTIELFVSDNQTFRNSAQDILAQTHNASLNVFIGLNANEYVANPGGIDGYLNGACFAITYYYNQTEFEGPFPKIEVDTISDTFEKLDKDGFEYKVMLARAKTREKNILRTERAAKLLTSFGPILSQCFTELTAGRYSSSNENINLGFAEGLHFVHEVIQAQRKIQKMTPSQPSE